MCDPHATRRDVPLLAVHLLTYDASMPVYSWSLQIESWAAWGKVLKALDKADQ